MISSVESDVCVCVGSSTSQYLRDAIDDTKYKCRALLQLETCGQFNFDRWRGQLALVCLEENMTDANWNMLRLSSECVVLLLRNTYDAVSVDYSLYLSICCPFVGQSSARTWWLLIVKYFSSTSRVLYETSAWLNAPNNDNNNATAPIMALE